MNIPSGIYRVQAHPRHRFFVQAEVRGGSRGWTVEADSTEEAIDLVRREVLAGCWYGDLWADSIW